MTVISVRDLVINYQNFTAVKGISFDVEPGQVIGILGGNGAGKSSTLRTLAGVSPFHSGEVIVDGVAMDSPHHIDHAREIVGYCPDVGGLIPQATAKEHIALLLSVQGKTALWDHALGLVHRFGLQEALDKQSKSYSHGMSRRLSVILAVLGAQKAIVLDEPYDGVDPIGVEETMNLIKEAKDNELGVVISTHLQDLLVECCDDILIMSRGEIISRGSVDLYKGAEGKAHYKNILGEHQNDTGLLNA